MNTALESYSGVDTARRQLIEFESQSLISEWLGHMTNGLHGATDAASVDSVLRAGMPIDGVRRIEYDDERDHWETALLTTLIDGHYGASRALISRGAVVDAANWVSQPPRGGFGHTALHMVVAQGLVEAAQILVDAGADVNRQTTMGTTPLIFASSGDNPDLVQLLLSRGADKNIPDFDGRLPRQAAGPRTAGLL